MSKIISFFSGCGSLDTGFAMCDFDIVWSHKADSKNLQTYKQNFKRTAICTKNLEYLEPSDLPQKISGFICGSEYLDQSKLKKNDYSSFDKIVLLAQANQPKFIYLDTSNAIIHPSNKNHLDHIISSLENIGYTAHYKQFNSKDFGAPINTKRVAIIAFQKKLSVNYWFPKKTPPMTVRDALDGMKSTAQPIKRLSTPIRTNVYSTEPINTTQINKKLILNWDSQAARIGLKPNSIPLHPLSIEMNKPRRLTIAECARLHNFPDDFIFHFNSINEGYQCVNASTPVSTSKRIAYSIKRTIESLYWF